MDILGAFPRAVFSEAETDIVRWVATKLGVLRLPSAHAVKRQRDLVLSLAGSGPTSVTSSHKNLYSITDLSQILRHEVSNPNVRPFLRFYPELDPDNYTDARHGDRWASEVPANLCAPMARAPDGQDYFVEEPAMARMGDSGTATPVWITRWFERQGTLICRVHPLSVDYASNTFIINADRAYDLPLTSLFLSLPLFLRVHAEYGLPSPSEVSGICLLDDDGNVTTQAFTPTLPNPWRTKAKGRRVFSLPLWIYCDDTSGNTSKRWNSHDTILFILAGLLHEHTLLPYNIHFMSTSNIASPLEMFEDFVRQVRALQDEGLVAWDCELDEEVMFDVWVLAGLGDNPMQSELSSHIGLKGKYFCRVCMAGEKIRTVAWLYPPKLHASWSLWRYVSLATSVHIRQRLCTSKCGTPRTRAQTIDSLATQHSHVLSGIPSHADTAATNTGVKDKHLTFFHDPGKRIREGLGDDAREALVDHSFEDMINPLLSLDHFDPNADTPVEILHVVLLGIVKYFWRDAVRRLDAPSRTLLKVRISSLDTSALGLPRLRGHTLVHYARSLTGRDFRAIVQVAPVVLHGLLPGPAWTAWMALCHLCPLLYQPSFASLDNYTAQVRMSIDDLLMATALWNTDWFNKPKFHILLHLPDHVRRFSPPILMATEGFESHNFVIRMRSVHSNRQAPSHDIAAAMSNGARQELASLLWLKMIFLRIL
ncbi:hypothetical protein BC834DRAFT_940012 [Gloeopeniophorella convolvens]|nr:hypothetical protein BC834DRAFT_940012 [Gloeopeniophorella convolvens]